MDSRTSGSWRSIVAACVAGLASACAQASSRPNTYLAAGDGWCQVEVRNVTQYDLDVTYWSSGGPRVRLGVMGPSDMTDFAVPCDHRVAFVSGQTFGGARLGRNLPWTTASARLIPGEIASAELTDH